MFRPLLIFISLILSGAICAQENKSAGATKKQAHHDLSKEGYVKAIVVNYKVENCGFLIELSDKEKTKLVPHAMPENLKKDKMKVWVKYTPAKKEMPSFCMAGKQCDFIEVKKRK